jgi:hypothetical protein
MKFVAILVATACALATGCFDPDIQEGLSCGPGDECPPDFECASDGQCHPEGEGPDIDAGANDPDAQPFPEEWPCDPVDNLGCGANEQCATVGDGTSHWTECVPWGNRNEGSMCSGILPSGFASECAPHLQCSVGVNNEDLCFEVCYRYMGEDSCESPSFCVQIDGIFSDLWFDDDGEGYVGLCT